jgi:hypothetical protein
MTERIKIREVIEYEIEVEEWEKEYPEEWPDYLDALGDVKTVRKDVLEREHLVDYLLDVDIDREVWILREDGVIVFESRSHDLRDDEYLKRKGIERGTWETSAWLNKEYDDRVDQDKTWRTLNAGRNK